MACLPWQVRAAVASSKPLALVHDPAKAGATLASIRDEECPVELRSDVFRNQTVIEWHRVKDFQQVSLKLLAERVLLGCPRRASSVAPLTRIGLYVPGELPLQRMRFPRNVLLHVGVMKVAR